MSLNAFDLSISTLELVSSSSFNFCFQEIKTMCGTNMERQKIKVNDV